MAFNDTLFQLGMDLTRSSTAQKEDHFVAEPVSEFAVRKDTSVERDRTGFTGHHLIIDLHGAQRLDDVKFVERTLKLVSSAAQAKVERVHLYRAGHGGVTGLAVLAEGHISVHTHPDTGFAAFDVLMTGNAKPQRCVEDLREAFEARELSVKRVSRGEPAGVVTALKKTAAAAIPFKSVKGARKAKVAA